MAGGSKVISPESKRILFVGFERVTGCAIGLDQDPEQHEIEVASMYDKLEHVVLPMFNERPASYAEVMRSAIALNGSFFNTQRMVSQYLANAYLPEEVKGKETALDRLRSVEKAAAKRA